MGAPPSSLLPPPSSLLLTRFSSLAIRVYWLEHTYPSARKTVLHRKGTQGAHSLREWKHTQQVAHQPIQQHLADCVGVGGGGGGGVVGGGGRRRRRRRREEEEEEEEEEEKRKKKEEETNAEEEEILAM